MTKEEKNRKKRERDRQHSIIIQSILATVQLFFFLNKCGSLQLVQQNINRLFRMKLTKKKIRGKIALIVPRLPVP